MYKIIFEVGITTNEATFWDIRKAKKFARAIKSTFEDSEVRMYFVSEEIMDFIKDE